MKIPSKVEKELTDKFEAALDYIPRFDSVPFHVKRDAAMVAAQTAIEYLKERAQ